MCSPAHIMAMSTKLVTKQLSLYIYVYIYIIYDNCPQELCNMNLHLYGDSFRNNKLNCIITMIVLCN